MNQEQKEKLKKFIRKKEEMKQPEITEKSTREDILAFLKTKGHDIKNLLEVDLEKISNLSNQ